MPTLERNKKAFNPLQGHSCPTLREAIHTTATCGTVPMKMLAAELDLSPSNLSMRTTLGADGIPFPADERLIRMQQVTGDLSILLTMAEALGCEVHPKRDHLPEILESIATKQADLARSVEQLRLMVPLADSVPASRRGSR